MKKILQTSPIFAMLALLLAACPLSAQGPDAFGYTWKTSNDPGGPTFNWVDITGVGTEVTGLGDDNAVPPMNMDMDFRFYWSDYDKITVGSNGWLSFQNISNIASCFPTIPTADTKNNLICPLMCDLNFANSSPGKIYTYHDQTPGNERFIVSYEGVTIWTQANPIFGSNTFQVILSKADSSITFQYLDMEADFTYNCTGSGKVAVGIENLSGNIGLQVYSGVMPASNLAVKFYYPQTITFSILDAAPVANMNDDNEGIFVVPGGTFAASTTVGNTGNTDINSGIDVAAALISFPDGNVVYADDQLVNALPNGVEQTITFGGATVDWLPGIYALAVSTDNGEDINPANDLNITEVGTVDTTGGLLTFGYVTGEAATGFIQWAGGGDGTGGGGIEIEPPVYPVTIAGLEAGIAGGSIDGFTFRIFDDDGPGGGPGTLLGLLEVAPDEYVAGNWNQYLLDDPITITSGSFYLGWFMAGNSVALLVEGDGPLSNRTYEILSNAWAKYRTPADAMLRAICEYTAPPSQASDLVQDSRMQVFPNPSHGSFFIDNSEGDQELFNPQVFNSLGALVFSEKTSVPTGQKRKLATSLPAGIYSLQLTTPDGRRIVRQVVVE